MLAILCFVLFAHFNHATSSNHKSIFILAGQSNMSGRGGVTNGTWNGVVPLQCHWNRSILRLTSGLKWVIAKEPLHSDIDVNTTCGVGPGLAFANRVLEMDPSLGVVGLVPCAVGGTKISEWTRGTYLYDQLVKRAKVALQGGGLIRAVLWYQGESDTVNQEDAMLYKGRLKKFFMDLRSDLKAPMVPIIQVALASGQGPFIEQVREAQLGTHLPNVRCVDAKGLPLEPDHLHLSTQAQIRLGEMLARAFLQTQPSPAQPNPHSSTYRPHKRFCMKWPGRIVVALGSGLVELNPKNSTSMISGFVRNVFQ